jgi:hypothetical protein
MFIMRIKISFIFIFCLTTCLFASFSEARTLDIRFIGIETSHSDLYVKQGSEYYPVSVPLYENSAYYEAETVDGNLQLYTKTETPEGPLYEIAVEGKIPENFKIALGVYIITPSGKPQLYFYDDDWSVFPGQSYRLINITPVAINSKVDETVLQVQPFQSDIVKVDIMSGLPLVRIITVYKDGNDEWKPIYNKRTALRSNWRITGISVITKGKLNEAMRITTSGEGADSDKAQLRYFSFKDTGPSHAVNTKTRNE